MERRLASLETLVRRMLPVRSYTGSDLAAHVIMQRKLWIPFSAGMMLPTIPGYSLRLDGDGDYILETQNIDLTATDFTWECFFTTEWTPTTDDQQRGLKAHGTGFWEILYEQAAGAKRLRVRYRIGTVWNNADYAITLVENQWYHVAVVYDNDAGMKLYLDGIEVASNTTNGNLDTYAASEVVGARWNLATPWLGNIDEVRLSNTRRYIANFTPLTQPFVDNASTLYLWHLDEGDGSTATDDDSVRGTNQDGSVQGNPIWDTSYPWTALPGWQFPNNFWTSATGSLRLPDEFAAVSTLTIYVLPKGTGNMRRIIKASSSIAGEDPSSWTTINAVGQVAVVSGQMAALTATVANLPTMAAGDVFCVQIERDGLHADDTVGAAVCAIGALLVYIV